MSADNPSYGELLNAINQLNAVVSSNPDTNSLANAMAQLTQAMANAGAY